MSPRTLSSVLGLTCIVIGFALCGAAAPLDDSVEGVVRAARDHQAALQRLLELQERDVTRAEAEVARRRDLAARELIARADIAEAETRAATARARVEDTRDEMARAETMIAEARAAAALARIPPPAPGHEVHTDKHIVFGGGPWSLARVGAVERFFATRFGRALPVSARGQTSLHDRLGFDHRHAIDVAVQPDTPEGRALLEFLKRERIPFIAFRAAEPGASTGAHVHIGEPSGRKPLRQAEADISR